MGMRGRDRGRRFREGGNGLFFPNMQIGCIVAVTCIIPGGLNLNASWPTALGNHYIRFGEVLRVAACEKERQEHTQACDYACMITM